MLPQIYSQIAETGVVSIIRGFEESIVYNTVRALVEGGIRAVEITFNTPGAAGIIERLKKEYSGKMTIGAGTVLDPETARIAILAGADYILSPSLNLKVIEVCNRYGKLAVPGVLTPTEVVNAMEAGAQIVKLFPARAFGPVYIKDLKSPLDQVEIMAVGGITIENAGEYIKNGAMSVGVGSELVNAKLVAAGNYGEISRKAALILENIRAARV
ncbi:MAG: bifunctional 4-hydroxy-2-oxoglutarate aldolase/2-dehydro-3-deoxy-phosphogluconate aldolase [Bacteroidota bacterium]